VRAERATPAYFRLTTKITAYKLILNNLSRHYELCRTKLKKWLSSKLLILKSGQGRNRTALCKRSQHPAYQHHSESGGVKD
jgi:hypothetical protein